MAINFPSAPSDGQLHTVGDVTWKYVAAKTAWVSMHGNLVPHTHAQADITSLVADLALKAALASPTFTGTPAAPNAAVHTNTTQLATTQWAKQEVANVEANIQTGTTYTLAIGDAGKMVTLNNAGAIALTIPTNAAVAFLVNTRIDLLQLGAGQVTIGGAGVTIKSSGSKLKLTGQYSGATLWKEATDTWVLIGDIAT